MSKQFNNIVFDVGNKEVISFSKPQDIVACYVHIGSMIMKNM